MKINCDKCGRLTTTDMTADELEKFGLQCNDCEQNAAEAAWERHCEDFHDGGSTQFKSLTEQMAESRKLK